jgi:hypothetical protein
MPYTYIQSKKLLHAFTCWSKLPADPDILPTSFQQAEGSMNGKPSVAPVFAQSFMFVFYKLLSLFTLFSSLIRA